MKASELRIGNTINNSIEDIVIDSIEFDDVESNWLIFWDRFSATEYLEDCKPIPLTEDWLLKFGFEKSLDYWMKSNSNFFFGITEKGDLMYLFDEDMICPAKIKHVHELQNLYFCLVGKELQITETAQ